VSAGTIIFDDIQSSDWSLCLDSSTPQPAPGTGIGNVVQGVADINQAIAIILSSPQGCDPLRPLFACNLWQWIDAPINVARPHLVREIFEAITRWEPRVQLLSVVVDLAATADPAHLIVTIVWRLLVDLGAGEQRLTLTVPRTFLT
jgi:phage baseplate assembly protein W